MIRVAEYCDEHVRLSLCVCEFVCPSVCLSASIFLELCNLCHILCARYIITLSVAAYAE